MNKNLKYYFKKTKKQKSLIWHFNFSNFEILKAIALASKELNIPILVGVSEGEENYIGTKIAKKLIEGFTKEYKVKLFLNADHHKSFESCKKCIDAGFNSVHFDGSELSFEENLKITKKVVEYKNKVNPEIMIEGEIGYILGSSKILKEKIELKEQYLTSPELAERFVKETKVDRLAISVGNIHGIYIKGNPKLRFDLIEKINKKIGNKVYLVLHGGSGIKNSELKKAVKLGITNIHINTEIRKFWKDKLFELLKKEKEKIAPYKIQDPLVFALKNFIIKKIKSASP